MKSISSPLQLTRMAASHVFLAALTVAALHALTIDTNTNSISLFEWVHNRKLEIQSRLCDLNDSKEVVRWWTKDIPEPFSPPNQIFDILAKCVLKKALIDQIKWYCVRGIENVLRSTRQSVLEYVVIRDNFLVNTVLAWNPRNNSRVLIHYEIDKEEEEVLAMGYELQICLPLVGFLHYGFFPHGPAIYVFSDPSYVEQLNGMTAGIIGKDRTKNWTIYDPYSSASSTGHISIIFAILAIHFVIFYGILFVRQ